jgi:hypothetical protein
MNTNGHQILVARVLYRFDALTFFNSRGALGEAVKLAVASGLGGGAAREWVALSRMV